MKTINELRTVIEANPADKLKIALRKDTDAASTYFVYYADMAMNCDGPCIDICDNYTELLLRHGTPTGYFTRGGGNWAVLPISTI